MHATNAMIYSTIMSILIVFFIKSHLLHTTHIIILQIYMHVYVIIHYLALFKTYGRLSV